jgi:hypothetical protein
MLRRVIFLICTLSSLAVIVNRDTMTVYMNPFNTSQRSFAPSGAYVFGVGKSHLLANLYRHKYGDEFDETWDKTTTTEVLTKIKDPFSLAKRFWRNQFPFFWSGLESPHC